MAERPPSLRPRFRAPPLKVAEIDLHLCVVDLLRKLCDDLHWEWTHFPAGEKREIQTAVKLQHMGLKPGWPDFIFIAWTGHIYCLELKSTTGISQPPQLAFAARMRAWAIEYRVARSLDEAIRILTGWGVLRRIVTKGEAVAQ